MSKKLGFKANVFSNITNVFCRAISKYDLKKDADPLGTMPNAKNPVLFIHGEEDLYVPCSMVYENYDACAAEIKQLLTVPGAGHVLSFLVDEAAYRNAVHTFLGKIGFLS